MSLTSIFLYLNRTKPAKAEYAKPRFEMPMFVIMGQKDYILRFPALKDYISSEKLKEIASDHEITYIPEGSHFVQEQFPELVNQLMIDFLCKHA
jgi:pimeloyl-ACP methyl ester carboxylesterase